MCIKGLQRPVDAAVLETSNGVGEAGEKRGDE